jgi:hypothetical protein
MFTELFAPVQSSKKYAFSSMAVSMAPSSDPPMPQRVKSGAVTSRLMWMIRPWRNARTDPTRRAPRFAEENPVRVRCLSLELLQGLSQRRQKRVAVQLRIEQERRALQSQQFAYVFVPQAFDDYVDAR